MLRISAARRAPSRNLSLLSPPRLGRVQPRRAANAPEKRLRLHRQQIPLAVIEWNTDFEVTAWNPAAERIFGYSAQEAVGKHARDLMLTPNRALHAEFEAWPALLARREGGEHFVNENRTRDGRIIWCEWYDTPLIDEQGIVVGAASVVLDITRQKALEREREAALSALTQREERFRVMTENSSDMISILDENMIVRYKSEAIRHLLGYAPAELLGANARDFIHPDDLADVEAIFESAIALPNRTTDPVVYRFRHKSGEWCWMEAMVNNLLDHVGVGGILVNSRDVTERVEADDKLRWQARHDALTGLPNRAYFVEQVEAALAGSEQKQKAALLFIDLNRFKWVNDTMGHDAGDLLLREIGQRLQAVLPTSGLLSRLSGDEFALLIPLARDRDAAQTARRVLHALSARPPEINGREVSVGASIGVAVFPHDGDTAEALLKAADTAMYRAKEHASYGNDRRGKAAPPSEITPATGAAGAGDYQFFTPQMHQGAAEAQAFETALRRAVRGNGEFCLVYQPIVDCATRTWQGVEALLRWRHPQLGLLGPDKFLQQVRESGLMDALNGWVLREACKTAALWRAGGVNLPLWVNVGGVPTPQIAPDMPLLEQIKEAMAAHHLPPDALVVEITPVMASEVASAGTLRALRSLGVGVALDDFGTGYSSLAALRFFPLTALKIDRALVQNIAASAKDAAFVRSVVAMAHALQFKVVAEGVESAAQEVLLREMECDLMQGYHIRRPLSAQNLTDDASYSALSALPMQAEGASGFAIGPAFRFALAGYNKKNAAA